MKQQAKVSGREWQRRCEQLLRDNLALQEFGKKAMENLIAIHKMASGCAEKTRLLIMPGVRETLINICMIAGPYAVPVPDIKIQTETQEEKKDEGSTQSNRQP